MAKEELSLDNVSELPTEETVATEVEPNENPTPPVEAVDEEGEPSDFMDALKDAMGEAPEAAETADEEGDKGVAGEENLSPSAKNFKKIKEDRDNARSEIDNMKKELEALKANSSSGDLEKIKQERDQFSEELKIAAIERHPEFRRKYEERAGQVISQSKELVSGFPGLDEKIAQLLFMADSPDRAEQLDNVFSEVGLSNSARLATLVTEMDKLQADRADELNNANATYDSLQEQGTAEMRHRLDMTHKTFDEVAQKASNLEMYQTKDGDDEWNSEVDSRMNVARSIFTGVDNQEDLALASLWAAAGPAYRQAYGAQMEVNRRLQQQIKDLTGANPTMQPQSDVSEQPKEVGFLEALNNEMGGGLR
jgi:hypothetical protein